MNKRKCLVLFPFIVEIMLLFSEVVFSRGFKQANVTFFLLFSPGFKQANVTFLLLLFIKEILKTVLSQSAICSRNLPHRSNFIGNWMHFVSSN